MGSKSLTHKLLAVLLAVSIVLGIVSTSAFLTTDEQLFASPDVLEDTLDNKSGEEIREDKIPYATEQKNDSNDNVSGAFSPVPEVPLKENDRESLEQIVTLLGNKKTPVENMDDEELGELVKDLVEDLEVEKNPDLPSGDSNHEPIVDIEENTNAYDDNGAMTAPFDQVYPELIEKGEVKYDDATLLIKMSNSRGGAITSGMAAAGVAKLEAIVPMESATWYEAKLVYGTDASAAVNALRQLSEVLLVEYNYQIKTASIDHYKDLPDRFDGNKHKDEQWHMHHCGIPDAMESMTTDGGSSSVVVAVIDTGVDFDHEDLSQNIWVNSGEIPDDGKDNDNNGYVDDYYGVNIVTGSGNGDDDNGHGTHVAGVIAAQNNNLGTVGIAYNVKIMPIKSAMASGYLNQSDIAKGILYAYEHGAEVINMSFGGTACSIAVQDALAVAYSRCVLVASAGNDGAPNEPSGSDMPVIPNYPAALSYVLGVMSVNQNGVESSFTNWDVKEFNGIEYELYAPGDSIMSTLPDNRYGSLSGTSMAAPMVSAMAAILRSEFTDRDTYPTKFIYGQLCSTSDHTASCVNPSVHGDHTLPQVVNLQAALTKMPKPEVGMQDYALFDTEGLANDTGVNNGDGTIDAGETLALGLTLRNRWGKSGNTVVKVDALSNAGIADPYVTILNPEVNYGDVGTYSTQDCGKIYTDELLTGWKNPFYIRIAENCPNDYIISLNVTITSSNGLDENDTAVYQKTDTIILNVRNGVVLPQYIEKDMVLTSDNLYIIPNATVIQEGVTVRVEPGTHIQFWSNDADDPYADCHIAYLQVRGKFLVEGTKENPVYIYPSELMWYYVVDIWEEESGYISMKYADITNFSARANQGYSSVKGDVRVSNAENCTFRGCGKNAFYRRVAGSSVYTDELNHLDTRFGQVTDSVFYKLYCQYSGDFDRCIFVDTANNMEIAPSPNYYYSSYEDCVFLGNNCETLDRNNQVFNHVSSARLDSLDINSISSDAFTLYYREETGTTYLRFYTNSRGEKLVVEEYVRMLGGDYLAVETEAEYNWITSGQMGKDGFDGNVNVYYDFKQERFEWSNGEPVADYIKWREGDTASSRRKGNISFHVTSGMLCVDSYGGYSIFEIPGDILPTEITLDKYKITLDLYSTYALEPITAPAQVLPQMLVYESTDEAVVTVNESGVITPVGVGTADVRIRSKDGACSNYITVTVVEPVALESMSFSLTDTELAIGSTVTPKLLLQPVDATCRDVVEFSSSDAGVATVNHDGKITAVSSGTATITAKVGEITAQMQVTVYRAVNSVSVADVGMTMLFSETRDLPAVTVSDGGEATLVWESIDPDVVELLDGKIVPQKAGTTTLKVTDTRTGLSDSFLLYVTEEALPSVVQVDIDNHSLTEARYYVLFSDGRLFRWGHDALSALPMLLADNVKCFDVENNYYSYLTSDNQLYSTYGQGTGIQISGLDNIVGCASREYDRFVICADGTAYAWCVTAGSNTYGHLGIGSVDTSPNEPTKVLLDNVVAIEPVHNATYFLTGDQKLYVAGGSGLNAATPVLIAERVTHLFRWDQYQVYYVSDGKIYSMRNSDVTPTVNGAEDAGFDLLAIPSMYIAAGSKDGKIYYGSAGSSIAKELPLLTAETFLLAGISDGSWKDGAFIAGQNNGLIYFMGNNQDGSSGGASVETLVTEPVVIPIHQIMGDAVRLVGSNISTEGVLNANVIELDFSKVLLKASATLTADGDQVLYSTSVKDNILTVTPNSGFVEGTAYTLTVPAANLYGVAGTKMAEDVVVTFTYEAPAEEESEPEKVIHESQFDETVDRGLWTPESLYERIMALIKEKQIHPLFNGNVILNPISTNTDVTKWLRFKSYTSSEYAEMPMSGNYWGTTNEEAINLQLVDGSDFTTYARFIFNPFLTEAPANVYPFVTDVAVLDKSGAEVKTVGNEKIKVRVNFSRDMDTSIPLSVTFGSAYPYADYTVDGTYLNAKVWEGEYQLNTLIENGNQYFNITNGCSATEDLILAPDDGRYSFVIDTTAAQALIMQGIATDTGIRLTWMQDDFDTLMGYNIYRSTSEDGYYQRINTTVIPAETKSYFDDTVEPGVMYYYNFTVVQTDLNESAPSGKVAIMSKDTMAPDIYHSPVYNAFTGANLVITATVTDNLSISYAQVHYRTVGTEDWKVAVMNNLNDKFSAIIPAQYVTLDGIEYYIEAYDGVSYTNKGSADEPFVITVQEAVDASSLGDVNGDGKISNFDALMLLQAINDMLNLTAEQFARADLNGDGELWTMEALRILHYVSGTVGSVDMS